jgi:ribosomal protein L40E
MSFDKVLSLPFSNGGFFKLLIGGILEIIPIVNFFSLGYILECYENGANNRNQMPEWNNWGSKFVNGILMLVVGFVYLIIPILIFGFLGVFKAIINPRYHLGSGTIFFGIILFIIFSLIVPMAMSNYAAKRNFAAAFDLPYIFKLVGSVVGSYIGAYFLLFLAGIISGIIMIIPVLGWIFAIFAGFYLGCVGGFLFGSVYARASQGEVRVNYGSEAIKVETTAAPQKIFCSKCGSPLSSDAVFCGNCGYKRM